MQWQDETNLVELVYLRATGDPTGDHQCLFKDLNEGQPEKVRHEL